MKWTEFTFSQVENYLFRVLSLLLLFYSIFLTTILSMGQFIYENKSSQCNIEQLKLKYFRVLTSDQSKVQLRTCTPPKIFHLFPHSLLLPSSKFVFHFVALCVCVFVCVYLCVCVCICVCVRVQVGVFESPKASKI